MITLARIIALSLFFNTSASAEALHGKALIVDGDTVRIDDQTIHLYGIDAPELNQFCTDKKGTQFNCGQTSKRRLFLYVGGDPLDCTVVAKKKNDSVLGTCRVKSYFQYTENGAKKGDKFDVGLEMVLTGYAFNDRSYANAYDTAEKLAATNKNGFWSGKFEFPWIWRKQLKRTLGRSTKDSQLPKN